MSANNDFHGHDFDYWSQMRLYGDDEQRWRAIDAIRHLCAPETSIPLLVDTLRNDTYWRARALAAHALYDLVACPQPICLEADALTHLREAVNDSSPDVRVQIEELLTAIGDRDPSTNT